MSTELAAARMGASDAHALEIEQACIAGGLTTRVRKMMFLATCYVESAAFQKTRESMGYSADRLFAVFQGRNGLKTLSQARNIVAAGQPAIAEAIYGGDWGAANLGNTVPGDGWKFIGRADIQITGRTNYTAYSMDTYGDLRCVERPEMLESLPDSVKAAVWYWNWRNCNGPADRGDLDGVTRKVKGAATEMEARRRALALAETATTYG